MLGAPVAGALAEPLGVRGTSGSYNVRVTSLKEARFRTVIRQQHDFSCGSAAVATLLTYQFGQPVTEAAVFAHMYQRGDQTRIKREGFSMLDLRRYLHAHGFKADGFELPLDKLLEQNVPAIVLIKERGYRHFVVIKGLRGERVLIGDPAAGIRMVSREKFRTLWDNNVLFVVHNRRDLARFNDRRDWSIAPASPLDQGVQRRGLHDIVIPKRGPGDI